MSRAFVRESDDRPELPMARPASALPEGAKNYLTPGGARRLRNELRQLIEVERPQAAAAASADPAAQTRLLLLNQRVAQLEQSLQSAEIVGPPKSDRDVVRFGATVTVRRSDGEEDDYRIVGVDEIDLDRGWVSWLSPIARALQNNRAGEHVRFQFPSGEEALEIDPARPVPGSLGSVASRQRCRNARRCCSAGALSPYDAWDLNWRSNRWRPWSPDPPGCGRPGTTRSRR